MTKTVDNKPMTLAEITTGQTRHEGLYFFGLGEDGEEAIACFEPGTPDRPTGSGDLTDARLARGLADYMNDLWDDAQTVEGYGQGWEERWVLITPHRDNCREDLEDDDECSCDEQFAWWAQAADSGTPGALRVMWWSS